MALTGSTRMQATTAMLLVIGLPLLYSKNKMLSELEQLIHFLENLELDGLLPFIVAETQIYQNQQNILYQTQPDYALTVLTDTTERSPTFNLLPFENRLDHPINHFKLA
jgi:N-acetylmuramic acid 6-phosphate etherase